jgi:valyl-tRNA synthetase
VYEQKVDVEAECARLKKEADKFEKGLASADRQLNNPEFLAKAPQKVVDGLRKNQEELRTLLQKTRDAMNQLGCPQ